MLPAHNEHVNMQSAHNEHGNMLSSYNEHVNMLSGHKSFGGSQQSTQKFWKKFCYHNMNASSWETLIFQT